VLQYQKSTENAQIPLVGKSSKPSPKLMKIASFRENLLGFRMICRNLESVPRCLPGRTECHDQLTGHRCPNIRNVMQNAEISLIWKGSKLLSKFMKINDFRERFLGFRMIRRKLESVVRCLRGSTKCHDQYTGHQRCTHDQLTGHRR
jgi:hypothetical protein